MIHPDSDFRRRWDFLALTVILYCSWDLPMDIAFYPEIEINAGFVVNCIFDAFFIMDIFLNFRTGEGGATAGAPTYITNNLPLVPLLLAGFIFHGKVIMDPEASSKHYFKNSFKYDFIASVPVDYFAFTSGGGSTMTKAPKFVRILRIFRLIRLFRLPRLFRYVRRFTEDFHVGYLRVLKLLFLLLLFSHWNACLLFLVATIENSSNSWVSVLGVEDHPVIDQYSWALFMSISHMLCIGYGVYPPETVGEVWAIIFSMSVGASLFACIVGSITAVLLSLDSASANFQGYINEVNAYFKHKEIPPELQVKVTQFLYAKWNPQIANEDVNSDSVELNGLKMYDEVKILDGLSPALRKELSLANCQNMLDKSPVFNKSFFPIQLQRWLAENLSGVIFLSSDIIIREGDVATEMYMLRRGKAVLESYGKEYGRVVEGSYCGEFPLVFSGLVKRQPFTVTAIDRVVEGFRYTKGAFEETLGHFPELLNVMQLVARQKVKKLGMGKVVLLDREDEAFGDREEEERETQGERIKQLEELFKKG